MQNTKWSWLLVLVVTPLVVSIWPVQTFGSAQEEMIARYKVKTVLRAYLQSARPAEYVDPKENIEGKMVFPGTLYCYDIADDVRIREFPRTGNRAYTLQVRGTYGDKVLNDEVPFRMSVTLGRTSDHDWIIEGYAVPLSQDVSTNWAPESKCRRD